jgi:hypothetical protein
VGEEAAGSAFAPGVDGTAARCERACRERSWATSSEASSAALMARVLGTMRRDWAKAAMASCSREPCGIRLVASFWKDWIVVNERNAPH